MVAVQEDEDDEDDEDAEMEMVSQKSWKCSSTSAHKLKLDQVHLACRTQFGDL